MNSNITADPSIVLREEFDDWALLYDPETGEVYSLNPIGVFVWKHLDGKHSVEDLFNELKNHCADVHEEARKEIEAFIDDLVKNGLAGSEV